MIMKPLINGFRLAVLAGLLLLPVARAFPPAPNNTIYGMVKDQYGTPLMNTADTVVLQTPSGAQVTAAIQPGLAIGVNYALSVPMDMGAPPLYVANALTNGAHYTLYVVVDTKTNLPMEMVGANPVMSAPGSSTNQNLTLGADANGDGIPDDWEKLFLEKIGATNSLASLNPNADYAHDGRTLRQEYLLGNYPYNPTDDFSVRLVSQNGGSAVLAFTTMTGRTYTAYGSPDLKNWTAVSFTVLPAGSVAQSAYYAVNIQPVQIQTLQPTNAPTMQFFRIQLQ